MFKTISAALLAASVIAAPAFAAQGKSDPQAPVIKVDQSRTKAMNAQAAVTPAEHRSVHTRHHRHHKMVYGKKHAHVHAKAVRTVTPKAPKHG